MNENKRRHPEGEKVRHILSISGGKDSSALAIYMKERLPEMEYVFCDTGSELKETYAYLDKLEKFLGKEINRLNSGKTFDYWLKQHNNYLPSPRARWCTIKMKIQPYEKFVGDDRIYSYIGIRADENREGYISSKSNIIPLYPFKEDGITKKDVYAILEKSGIGIPEYYKWRSRSGCYFCFFQQKVEWVGLLEKHPDLFEQAKQFEKLKDGNGETKFTWVQGRELSEIEGDKENIRKRAEIAKQQKLARKRPNTLYDIYSDAPLDPDDEEEEGCLVCHL